MAAVGRTRISREMAGHGKGGTQAAHTINLAGASLHCPCHVCAFYNSADEQYDALLPFVKEGLDAGEHVVLILGPAERDARIERLRGCGIDVDATQRTGQLEIEVWQDTYLRDGRFDTKATLDLVQGVFDSGIQRGFSRTRGWANMEWALTPAPGVEQLPYYESCVNFIMPQYNDVIVCAYDVTRFPALLLEHVARGHPYLLADGFVQENPYYVPPEELTGL
jgi:hypothetical protein